MEKASSIIQRLAAAEEKALTISERQLRRAESIEMARNAEPAKQSLVFSSRPFVLCGLPVKRPAKGVLLHERRNGKFVLEVTGHPKYGLPFGQDRLIPIWVATLALRQKNRRIVFRSAAEILETFGLPKDGRAYRRLVEGFQRIFAATIFFGTDEKMVRGSMHDYHRFHFFDQMKVWYAKDLDQQQLPAEEFENVILLSQTFWDELSAHPIPINLNAIKLLANAPAELDFYTWLVWRCWTAKREALIPLTGEGSLLQQLGISEKTATREFRRQVKRWLAHIKAPDIWPDCPAKLTPDGSALIIVPARTIHPRLEG
jgi:hypothetical protein